MARIRRVSPAWMRRTAPLFALQLHYVAGDVSEACAMLAGAAGIPVETILWQREMGGGLPRSLLKFSPLGAPLLMDGPQRLVTVRTAMDHMLLYGGIGTNLVWSVDASSPWRVAMDEWFGQGEKLHAHLAVLEAFAEAGDVSPDDMLAICSAPLSAKPDGAAHPLLREAARTAFAIVRGLGATLVAQPSLIPGGYRLPDFLMVSALQRLQALGLSPLIPRNLDAYARTFARVAGGAGLRG